MNFEDFDIRWHERDDADQLWQMRLQLEDALQKRGNEYSIHWRLARWHHFAAMLHNENPTKSSEHFQQAMRHAQLAYIEQLGTEAMFWLAVNLLEFARLQNKVATLKTLPHATQMLKAVTQRDKSFHFAGALRVLGRITHLKPKFLRGGARKSLPLFERALEIAPQNSTTRLYYAEALLPLDKAKAEDQLQEIVSQPRDDEWRWEQTRDREIARKLLISY
jgi:thioredoxin-like negative regulator of GroEL